MSILPGTFGEEYVHPFRHTRDIISSSDNTHFDINTYSSISDSLCFVKRLPQALLGRLLTAPTRPTPTQSL